MISICIPIFNVDIQPLVSELSAQVSSLPVAAEIILIDDASRPGFREKNRLAGADRYIQLEQNIGRSRIRNLFRNYTGHEYLLFLDCDSLITDPGFLLKYVDAIPSSSGVVCGGRIYATGKPARNRRLAWKYGRKRESRSVTDRKADPHRSFMSNNFLVRKTLFDTLAFDERLAGYGHEDTLFGYQLAKAGIPVLHIDNPVLHGQLETNRNYLQKSREAISNLLVIRRFLSDPQFVTHVRLLNTYERLRQKKVFPLIRGTVKMLLPATGFLLANGINNLGLFDLYKLGCLIDQTGAESQNNRSI